MNGRCGLKSSLGDCNCKAADVDFLSRGLWCLVFCCFVSLSHLDFIFSFFFRSFSSATCQVITLFVRSSSSLEKTLSITLFIYQSIIPTYLPAYLSTFRPTHLFTDMYLCKIKAHKKKKNKTSLQSASLSSGTPSCGFMLAAS